MFLIWFAVFSFNWFFHLLFMTSETLDRETLAFFATILADPKRQPQELVFPETRFDLGMGFILPQREHSQSQ